MNTLWQSPRIIYLGALIAISNVITGCRTLDTLVPSRVPERISREISESRDDSAFSGPLQTIKASGNQYSATNAYNLARICYLVWQEHKGAVEAIAKDEWGLASRFVELKETDTQYVIIGNSEFTALAFRATQSKWLDVWTALKNGIYETSDGGRVYRDIPAGHAGFRAAAAHAVLNGIVSDINSFRDSTGASQNNAPVFVTGHSLGGAIALLTRPYLQKNGVMVDSVYVYGAPVAVSTRKSPTCPDDVLIFDTTFLHRFNGRQHAGGIFRRYQADNVPLLRPLSDHYRAPGNSFEIDAEGNFKAYPEYKTLEFVGSASWSFLWLTNIVTPHNLRGSYLPALRRAALDQKAPPIANKWWRESIPCVPSAPATQ